MTETQEWNSYHQHQASLDARTPNVWHPFHAPWMTRSSTSFRDMVRGLDLYAGVYLIVHRPTAAVYVGKAEVALAPILRQWRSRLSAISGTPPLNVAFRAVYTSRYDFDFALVHTAPCDPDSVKFLRAQYASLYERVRARYPTGQCLNVEKPKVEQYFWTQHLRLDFSQAKERFEMPVNDRKALQAHRRLKRENKAKLDKTIEALAEQAQREHTMAAEPVTHDGERPAVRKIIIPGFNDGTS